MNSLHSHIPFVRLVDLVDGRISAAEQAELASHLVACPRCAADLAWLKHVHSLMRSDTSEDAPAHVIAVAKRLFQPRRAPARPSVRQRLTAALQFDSARRPFALGMRAGAAVERQMLFAIDRYVIDVRVAPSGALWAVSGQLLGADAGAEVELSGRAETVSTELSEVSEFSLPPVSPGSYVLTLRLAEHDLTIGELELGA